MKDAVKVIPHKSVFLWQVERTFADSLQLYEGAVDGDVIADDDDDDDNGQHD